MCFLAFIINAQNSLPELLQQYNTKNIPYMSIQELAMPKTEAILFDAREENEFKISHLKNAILVGFDQFSMDSVFNKVPNKDEKIVVYCSIGIRSEIIASKLKKAGYKHVFNLYGGIFEWKNNNLPVYNSKEKETDSVHVSSAKWDKWLKKGHKVF
jgi:rhodanese-related sulfurtransferase